MTKKLLSIFILIVFSSSIIKAQTFEDSATLNKISKIPSMKLKVHKGGTQPFSSLFLPNRATVVLFFSPTCDHCRDEITHLQQEISNFPDTDFLLMTNRPKEMIDTFYTNMHIDTLKNFKIVYDAKNELTRFYGVSGYPSMIVYNYQKVPKVKYLVSTVPPKMIWDKIRE